MVLDAIDPRAYTDPPHHYPLLASTVWEIPISGKGKYWKYLSHDYCVCIIRGGSRGGVGGHTPPPFLEQKIKRIKKIF